MSLSIPIEALPVLTHQQIPVMTTELIANLYEAEPYNIQQNFNNNQRRFVPGKHYFKVTGEDLRSFKQQFDSFEEYPDYIDFIYVVKPSNHSPSLLLWTERGAARHAKMLGTDPAWDTLDHSLSTTL
ncbi:MAG: ORF6N domain-containing protein [Sedimenticola sp.]